MDKGEILCEIGYEESITLVGFDDAIIGTTDEGRVVYSFDKIVRCLNEQDGMDYESAVDYISFNILRSLPYYENGPIVVMNESRFSDAD